MASNCPYSNTWALRGYKGTCPSCGKKVSVRSDGKLAVHKGRPTRSGKQ